MRHCSRNGANQERGSSWQGYTTPAFLAVSGIFQPGQMGILIPWSWRADTGIVELHLGDGAVHEPSTISRPDIQRISVSVRRNPGQRPPVTYGHHHIVCAKVPGHQFVVRAEHSLAELLAGFAAIPAFQDTPARVRHDLGSLRIFRPPVLPQQPRRETGIDFGEAGQRNRRLSDCMTDDAGRLHGPVE
jgi:hypothetical protein